MTPERWQQVEALFDAVLGAAESERAALLDAAEPTVRAEVERLLAAHDAEDDGFLAPVARLGELGLQDLADAAFAQDEDRDDLLGTTVGAYRLVQRLGRGGMGTVWLAEDERSGRKVALKRLNSPSARMMRRFRREIRTLQRLDHPGVVELLDHGTSDDGVPWYAMRLLRGRPLTDRLIQERLRWSLLHRDRCF